LALSLRTSSPAARIRLLADEPHAPAPEHCEIAGDTREARRLASGDEVVRRIHLPSAAVLHYAVASAAGETAAGTWRLTVERPNGGVIAHDEVQTNDHWAERSVDLADHGGEDVVVRARATGAATCWGAPSVTSASRGPSLVVVILLDTVRADHMQLY